jgi:hypothetical protein
MYGGTYKGRESWSRIEIQTLGKGVRKLTLVSYFGKTIGSLVYLRVQTNQTEPTCSWLSVSISIISFIFRLLSPPAVPLVFVNRHMWYNNMLGFLFIATHPPRSNNFRNKHRMKYLMLSDATRAACTNELVGNGASSCVTKSKTNLIKRAKKWHLSIRGRLHLRFRCAFHCRMRFHCHFQCPKLHRKRIQQWNAHPKRKCNQPLIKNNSRQLFVLSAHTLWSTNGAFLFLQGC